MAEHVAARDVLVFDFVQDPRALHVRENARVEQKLQDRFVHLAVPVDFEPAQLDFVFGVADDELQLLEGLFEADFVHLFVLDFDVERTGDGRRVCDDVLVVGDGVLDEEPHVLRAHLEFGETDFTLLRRRLRDLRLDVFDRRRVGRLQTQSPVVDVFRAVVLHDDVVFG